MKVTIIQVTYTRPTWNFCSKRDKWGRVEVWLEQLISNVSVHRNIYKMFVWTHIYMHRWEKTKVLLTK